MARRLARILLTAAVSALLGATALAGTASASPAWSFEGEELVGAETIEGEAVLSSFTIPGLTTKCKEMTYAMSISNSIGVGKGQLKELGFNTCVTDSPACTVKVITAEALPWPAHLATFSLTNYVVFEGVKIAILYGGAECILSGTWVIITGTVGGRYDNPTETFTFSAANSKATKTALKALGGSVEWNGAFTTEATGAHGGEALTVS